ncbi:MAG: nucleoside triphosphate pyrophosphohydrolase [Chloroflexi bacterium]|nr:nucleoside triphosphate pyrophosphohydrolase [Chloroflexota bacterium]
MDQNPGSLVEKGGITLLGLGPGSAGMLTREARKWMQGVDEIYLRSEHKLPPGIVPKNMRIGVLRPMSGQKDAQDENQAETLDRLLELGRRIQGVTLALPGDPFESTLAAAAIRRASVAGVPCRVIPGVGRMAPALAAAGLSVSPHAVLVEGTELVDRHSPSFPPDGPVVIAGLESSGMLGKVKTILSNSYPSQHPLKWIVFPGGSNQKVTDLTLDTLDQQVAPDGFAVLVVPPLAGGTSLEAFQEIIAHLRAPDGCPWDRQQTHLSLRTHLLEETYEALEALDSGNQKDMVEEFGDLLLQIVLHAQIAYEAGEFNMADILEGVYTKIVRRHPHVFGDTQVEGVKGVLQNWEKLKAAEREQNGDDNGKKGLLDGVPRLFPALAQSQELQDRAARVGFDWPDIQGVLDKVREEIDEVRQATNDEALADEIGDLLFALVNLARWKKVDAESALRKMNARFRFRFGYIERTAEEQGREARDLTLEEMDALWEEAKKQES